MASCSYCRWWDVEKGCVRPGGVCPSVEAFWRGFRRLVRSGSGPVNQRKRDFRYRGGDNRVGGVLMRKALPVWDYLGMSDKIKVGRG